MEIAPTQISSSQIVYQKSPVIKYKIKDGIVFIIEVQDHFIQKILRKLHFKIPEKTYLELDEYGSFVFQQINGEVNVNIIGQKLAYKYKETEKNLYERLTLYLDFLETNKKYIYKMKSM